MDFDLLSDRRNHRNSLKRLAGAGVFDPGLFAHQRDPVPGVFGRLCACAGSARDDRAARGPRLYRRRTDPDGLYADHHAAAEGEATGRPGAVRGIRHLRARDRPDHRRLSDRELGLAVHLLCQFGARLCDDRHAVVFARSETHAAVAAAPGRLARRHHHGDRLERAADRARGRQQGRLVRFGLHCPVVCDRRRRAGGVPVD